MNPFVSLRAPIAAEEEMDAAELASERYAKVLADLSRINVLTLAARPTIGFLERVRNRRLAQQRPWRILDVGFGGGDMLAQIARWGERRGVELDLTGVDLNPKSEAAARHRLDPKVRLITGDYRDLADEPWDIILSSLVTHHMSPLERADFLRFMDANAALGWLVNDLHRRRLPFMGYPLLAMLAWVDPIVKRDGQLSVGRSFRRDEWQAMLADSLPQTSHLARIYRIFPYRLCVERVR